MTGYRLSGEVRHSDDSGSCNRQKRSLASLLPKSGRRLCSTALIIKEESRFTAPKKRKAAALDGIIIKAAC